MNRQEAEILLQKTFGLPKFYGEQWQTIEKVLHGERVLLIENEQALLAAEPKSKYKSGVKELSLFDKVKM